MALRGNLADFGVVEVLQLLASQGKTGILRLHNGGVRASFVFQRGEIVSTWDRNVTLADPFKTYILRKQFLPERQTLKALRLEARTDLPFADILLREGMIDVPEISRMIREQVIEEIRRILGWDSGTFEFSPEPSVSMYGPGCTIKVESVLLAAAREIDEDASFEKEEEPETAVEPDHAPAISEGLRSGLVHALFMLVLPIAASILSYVAAPAGEDVSEEPLLGVRIAEFSMEREVRNLRLVLEMYDALYDRYPKSLTDLVQTGLLSGEQVLMLRNREIRYRSLRGGERYFLHSGKYGPLVRGLPADAPLPKEEIYDHSRYGSLRRPPASPELDP